MASDPAFLFYPGDYLRDTQCLSEKSQVAYDRIMCEHMRNICVSQKQLNFFTKRLSVDEIEELKMVLVEKEEGFFIKWVVESISKRLNFNESRRKNRLSKSNIHMNDICASYVPHMENENENENIIVDESSLKGVVENFEQADIIEHELCEHIKRCYPNVCTLKSQLTSEEAEKLLVRFSFEKIEEMLMQMENKNDLKKKYKSVYLTIISWINLENKKNKPFKSKQETINENYARAERETLDFINRPINK